MEDDSENKRKEIFTYQTPWTAYSMSWRNRREGQFQMAVSSFKEEYSNQIHVVHLVKDDEKNDFVKLAEFDHPYPATKVMWAPANMPLSGTNADMMVTTGDYVRVWNVNNESQVTLRNVLNNSKQPDFCAPVTSFDWNETDPTMIGSCSIDTTCTIWDLNTMAAKTQLIAHDKEVYDIAFACGKDIFSTVGGDGSLRLFDLRSLEHSTILYESPGLAPLMKLVWNKQDPNYIATILAESNKTVVIDVRSPSVPVAELIGHGSGVVNGLAWAPHSSQHLCTCGEDRQALIWELPGGAKPTVITDAILSFAADSEINSLHWAASHQEWVSICFDNKVQVLKV